jgi:vacuolar-type H+-ATPase subunit F/Vma7
MLVIGSEDAVWGFALAGVRGQVVKSDEELSMALDAVLADKTVDIVLVTEDVRTGLASGWTRSRYAAPSPW